MNRFASAALLFTFLGLAACDAGPTPKVEPAVSNELKALPGASPVVNPSPVDPRGGVRDPSVRPVNGKSGIPDDSIRPVGPTKLRTGIPDDSIKPAPKP